MMTSYNSLATNTMGTKEWLAASKDMKISAYAEGQEFVVEPHARAFATEDFEQTLRKVSRRIKPSLHDSAKLET